MWAFSLNSMVNIKMSAVSCVHFTILNLSISVLGHVMNLDINTKQCPFCKTNNHCAVESGQNCWCYETGVPRELSELLPASLKNKSCICSACIRLFNQNPIQFSN